jgi:hypothetical protein
MGVKTVLVCDHAGCGKELTLAGPYMLVKNEMKEKGWRNRLINEKWEIRCPEHAGAK